MSTPFTVFFSIFLKLLNNAIADMGLRSVAGWEIHGPRGRSRAVDVSGGGAYADLVGPAVEDV